MSPYMTISTSRVPSPQTRSTGPWPIIVMGFFFAPDVVHTGVDIPVPEDIPIMASRRWHGRMGRLGLFSGPA